MSAFGPNPWSVSDWNRPERVLIALRVGALGNESTLQSKRTYLDKLIERNELDQAKSVFKFFSPETRREIALPSSSSENRCVIFNAVEKSIPEFIRFLVEEFNIDLEEEFVYPAQPPNDVYTPLSYAVELKFVTKAEELILLGANVNAFSPKTGLGPLHRACRDGTSALVISLVENGADLTKKDERGFTALMYAIPQVDICRLLIDNAADVKTANIFGDTALHIAAERVATGIAMLLLEKGADPLQKNFHGDDALSVACIACGKRIVEEMMARTSGIDIRRRIEVHQLLGACYLFCDYPRFQVFDVLKEWRCAIELREKNRHLILEDDFISTPNPAYEDAVEIDSITGLDELQRDEIYAQGLLLLEKILGPNHKKTVSEVIRRGKMFLKNKDCTRGLRLLGYGLKLSHDRWLNSCDRPFYIENMKQICECLRFLSEIDDVGNRLEFEDVYEVLKTTAFQAMCLINTVANELIDKRPNEHERFIQIVLYMMKLFCCQKNSEEQMARFKSLVRGIVRLNLRSSDGRTLLMNSISTLPVAIPSSLEVDVIELLLECRACATEKDYQGNSALHFLGRPLEGMPMPADIASNRRQKKKVAEILLEFGAHVDVRNKAGLSIVGVIKCLGLNSPKPLSLQCLAAQAILRHKVLYAGILPKHMVDFVEIHE